MNAGDLCGARYRLTAHAFVFCTKAKNHRDDLHVAAVGPWRQDIPASAILAMWRDVASADRGATDERSTQ